MSDKNNEKEITKIVNNENIKITAKFGFSYIKGNSQAYFHVTGDMYEKNRCNRWEYYCGGCIHDEISKHFPELKSLIDFHSWGQNTMLPMYYIENGCYFFEQWKNAKGCDELEKKSKTFKDFINYQEGKDSFLVDIKNIEFWLENRKPMIQKMFTETMDKFGIERIKM